MAEHSLEPGRNLIAALHALGEALGYHVEREHPVETSRSNPPAVDIAWFSEKGQAYPLMIFEVESRATSGVANNVTKVFGQPSAQFEKPLFFFHIVLKSADSTRLDALERLFGTYNYRSFNLSKTSVADLLEAALAQHRRVWRTVWMTPLRTCLDQAGWAAVPPVDLVHMVRRLRFEADFEPSLARSALRGEADLAAMIGWLETEDGLAGADQSEDARYQTFLGGWFSHPLHLGVVAAQRPALAAEMAERYRAWQKGTGGGMARIGPYLGLDRDYDEFLVGGAPALCATVGALIPEVAGELLDTLNVLRQELAGWAGAPNAIWTLHLAAFACDDEAFDAARDHLNGMGGVNELMATRPAAFYEILSGERAWAEALGERRSLVPARAEFGRRVRSALPPGLEPSATKAALLFLTDDQYGIEPPLELIGALAERP